MTNRRGNVASMESLDQDITSWLNAQDQGGSMADRSVNNELFTLLYQDLHRVAGGHMRKEHAGHTLSATALTHEAWFRMGEQSRTQWASRSHFLAVASTIMRRILVHHALAKKTQKRDVDMVSITAPGADLGLPLDHDLVAVHDALLAFESLDARAAKVVELRFFGGMENTEIAEALGISVPTVKREWGAARAWLMRELESRP
jgi:RNA polymerase sigma factor (TIGR02999 family)